MKLLILKAGREVTTEAIVHLTMMRNTPWVYWTNGLEGKTRSRDNSYIVRSARHWGSDGGVMNQRPQTDASALHLVSINGIGETRWYAKVPQNLEEIADRYWQGSADDTREALDYFFEEIDVAERKGQPVYLNTMAGQELVRRADGQSFVATGRMVPVPPKSKPHAYTKGLTPPDVKRIIDAVCATWNTIRPVTPVQTSDEAIGAALDRVLVFNQQLSPELRSVTGGLNIEQFKDLLASANRRWRV
jgi:hypothetical protein